MTNGLTGSKRVALGGCAVVLLLAGCSGTGGTATASITMSVSPPPHPSSNAATGVEHPMSDLRGQTSAIVGVGGAPHAPDWQVLGFGSVWVSNEPRNLVQRIDPKTNDVIAKIPVNVPCDGLGAGFGSIWVPDCADSLLARIDPSTNRVVKKIPTSIAGADNEGEGLFGVGATGVWLLTAPDTLSRIDPATDKVATSVRVTDGSYAAIVGFGSVWVSSEQVDLVTRVDPAGHVVATIPVGHTPLFLTAGEGGVWVLNQGDGSVSHIDPATNTVVATVDARSPGGGGCIAAGLGSIWVSIPGAPLTRIDPATNSVTERFVGSGGDCLSAGFGSVWLSNHDFGNVWRIRP
jgi:YVTN family beta-propeller protein